MKQQPTPTGYPSLGEPGSKTIQRWMRLRGETMAGDKLWSDEEIQIIRSLYPDYVKIESALKTRTLVAIKHKCRAIGLGRRIHLWSAGEIAKLRRLFPSASKEKLMAEFSFTTWQNIRSTAYRYGFRQKRRPYPKAANPLMNAVLERCMAIGWSMADLDAACGFEKYFNRRNWTHRTSNSKAVFKAIEVLGGKVSVVWD